MAINIKYDETMWLFSYQFHSHLLTVVHLDGYDSLSLAGKMIFIFVCRFSGMVNVEDILLPSTSLQTIGFNIVARYMYMCTGESILVNIIFSDGCLWWSCWNFILLNLDIFCHGLSYDKRISLWNIWLNIGCIHRHLIHRYNIWPLLVSRVLCLPVFINMLLEVPL